MAEASTQPLAMQQQQQQQQQRHHHPGNATAVLQQARAGLTTALREVRTCRAQKAQCQDELSACKSGSASLPVADDGADSLARREESDAALSRARADVQEGERAYAELRKRAEDFSANAQHQLATLKAQLKAAATAESECKSKLEGAVAAEAAQQQQQLLATKQTLGVLRRKLEQKEQLEDAIEGKSSKLTEVYRALEADCQAELQKCKGGAAAVDAAAPPTAASPRGLSATPGEEAATARRLHGGGEEAAAPCTAAGSVFEQFRLLIAVFAAGGVAGWAARGGSRSGGRRGGGAHVEEMRGWMPVSSNGDAWKLS